MTTINKPHPPVDKNPTIGGGWRGHGHGSGGIYGANLAYSVANPPPSGSLGQSYVSSVPTPRLPIRPVGGNMPGVQYGVPGRATDPAAGNPAVNTTQQYVEQEPYGGSPGDGISQFGSPRILGVGQETSWRGGANFANDKLISYDRHVYYNRGNERSGRDSGNTDPPMDGPARPSLVAVNRTINYQQGTDNDAAQDDLSRPYARNAQGMYLGTQGDTWNLVYGGTPGLWQPYGSYEGYTAGPVKGIQSPVGEGEPGDGRQSFQPGPPHGLHSPTLPDYAQTLGYYMATPQMRAPRIDRPSNSPIGGQSYSQTVQPQGQTGTIAMQASGQNLASGMAGVNWQATKVSGWRGQAGSGNAS